MIELFIAVLCLAVAETLYCRRQSLARAAALALFVRGYATGSQRAYRTILAHGPSHPGWWLAQGYFARRDRLSVDQAFGSLWAQRRNRITLVNPV